MVGRCGGGRHIGSLGRSPQTPRYRTSETVNAVCHLRLAEGTGLRVEVRPSHRHEEFLVFRRKSVACVFLDGEPS